MLICIHSKINILQFNFNVNTKVIDKKTCANCFEEKSIECFYKRQSSCKVCCKKESARIVQCRRCNDPYIPGKRGRGRYCTDKCRFMDKVSIDEQSGCWLWQGHCQKNRGYGTFILSGWKRSGLAHRASYIIFKGELKENDCVIHSCDNVKCVSPKHLSAGSHLANMRDMIKKGRSNYFKGSMHPSSKLKEQDVLLIRDLFSKGHKASELAKKFNIVTDYIYTIVNKKSWKHV